MALCSQRVRLPASGCTHQLGRRPLRPVSFTRLPCTACPAGRAQHQGQEQQQEQVQHVSSWLASTGMGLSAWALLGMRSLAWAVEDEEILEASDAVAQAVNQEQSALDLFVGIAFGGVVLLLSVVTLGIAYLSLKTWLDNRQEQQDKEAEKNGNKADGSAKPTKSKEEAAAEEVLALKSLKKASRAPLDKSKGFGSLAAKNPKEF